LIKVDRLDQAVIAAGPKNFAVMLRSAISGNCHNQHLIQTWMRPNQAGHRIQIEDEGDRFWLANTRVMMLHHGRIIFEGPDELFWKSNDPVIREFVEYDMAPQ